MGFRSWGKTAFTPSPHLNGRVLPFKALSLAPLLPIEVQDPLRIGGGGRIVIAFRVAGHPPGRGTAHRQRFVLMAGNVLFSQHPAQFAHQNPACHLGIGFKFLGCQLPVMAASGPTGDIVRLIPCQFLTRPDGMNPPTDQTLGLPAPGVRYLGSGHECHPSRGSTISGTKNGAKVSSLLDSLAGNKIAHGAWKPLKS